MRWLVDVSALGICMLYSGCLYVRCWLSMGYVLGVCLICSGYTMDRHTLSYSMRYIHVYS